MKTIYNFLFLIAFPLVMLTSCNKDDETVTPVETTIVANAGADINLVVAQKAELNGSGSNSTAGTLTYAWALKTKPEGSTAVVVKANEVKAEFTPDIPGAYVFELTVDDTKKTSKDEVTVTATAIPYDGCLVKDQNITTPTIWVKRAPAGQVDYCITKDLTVYSTLTIEPSVVIEFEEGVSLIIDGNESAIKAIGTETNKIIFTGKEKTNGFWKGIEMNSSMNEQSEFRYAEISYAGSSTHVSGFKAALSLRNSSIVKVHNTLFDNNSGYGMAVQSGQLMGFSQNTFTNNTTAALFIPTSEIGHIDGESEFNGGNGRNGVEVQEGSVNEDSELVWPALKNGGKYFFLGNTYINSGVKIQEGAILEFNADRGIYIDGTGAYLSAKGSENKKIIFTGIEKEKGAWKGIEFSTSNGAKNEFDFCEISYAGGVTHVNGYKAGIASRNNVEFKFTNSKVSNSKGYGIAIFTGTFTEFANNQFDNNGSAAMILPPSAVGKLDNASLFSEANGRPGIELSGGTVDFTEEQVWPAFNDGSKYFIMDNIYVNSGIKIEPGAVLEFNADKALFVTGSGSYLFARGTADKKILFTGIEKTNGYWKGIEFSSTTSSKNEFNHTGISYAGSSNHVSGYKANISIRNNAEVAVLNSEISNSAGWGITHIYATLITDQTQPNTFSGNTSGDIKSN